MAYVSIHVPRHLNEKLAWATDKWLWLLVLWVFTIGI